jgi:hypothetical protein
VPLGVSDGLVRHVRLQLDADRLRGVNLLQHPGRAAKSGPDQQTRWLSSFDQLFLGERSGLGCHTRRHNDGMAASNHSPASRTDPAGSYADDLALYRQKFQQRLPASLEELRGPAHGVVDLPLHVAWSGLTSYDLDKPRQRMGLYRTVLHEGLREDLVSCLNRDVLLELWPTLRGLVGRTVRTVWEDAFPQLATRGQAAA